MIKIKFYIFKIKLITTNIMAEKLIYYYRSKGIFIW